MIPPALIPILGEIFKNLSGSLDKSVSDKDLQAKLTHELEKHTDDIQNAMNTQQNEINKEYAKKDSLFLSGARPFVLWVCGIGFAYHVLVQPILAWASLNFGWVVPPDPDTTLLTSVLLGMLGMSGIRSYDKTKGNHLK